MSDKPTLIVCMGVSGSGKTTLAHIIAAQGHHLLFDADDFHSEANKILMRRGIPLTNEHRSPWMLKVCGALGDAKVNNRDCVIAHSGLQAEHRQQLRDIGFRTVFAFLDGDSSIIAQRIGQRVAHFMPAKLLDTQYAALQDPRHEPDVLQLNVAHSPELLADQVLSYINASVERKSVTA